MVVSISLVFVSVFGVNGCESLLEGEIDRAAKGERWGGVTSHIAWKWRCAYMYKCTIYDTTRFKAVMVMNLLELHS